MAKAMKLQRLRHFLNIARKRARKAERNANFLQRCMRDQTEAHQREREELKRDLAQARAFNSAVNGRLARLEWHGPVKSMIDGNVYNTPESYAAHLVLHNKVIN
jgi:hypothetical protein